MILEYKGKRPVIGDGVFIAPTAVIIGDVTIGEGASIWYGTVVRGDIEPITIGAHTNIQDNAVLHTDHGMPLSIGDHVTVGHLAIVHGATVEHHSLIGMGAVVMNQAVVKAGSVVAAGAVVKEKQAIGPHHLVAGNPATFKKDISHLGEAVLQLPADMYRELAAGHLSMNQTQSKE